MTKKIVLLVVIGLFLLAAGFFVGMRRSHMMGAGGQTTAGGLEAVSIEGNPVSAPASTGSLPLNTAIQESGGLVVSLALDPYPPSVAKPANFDVALTTSDGQPVADADISLDLTMPSMWMPPNQLTMEQSSAGQYHAGGRFTMRGWWRIEVIITRGAEKQSVFFDVGL